MNRSESTVKLKGTRYLVIRFYSSSIVAYNIMIITHFNRMCSDLSTKGPPAPATCPFIKLLEDFLLLS